MTKIYQQLSCLDGIEYRQITNYPLKSGIINKIRELVPVEWKVFRSGVWLHFSINNNIPEQGWKIHISATFENRIELLNAAIPYLVDNRINFKVLADDFGYEFINSKLQNLGSSGKFVTIYPANNNEFRLCLEGLYQTIRDFDGPYILSDRRYKDCKCLYYRYGGFKKMIKKDEAGLDIYCIKDPSGTYIEDGRKSYFDIPYWVNDPFEDQEWFKTNYDNDDTELFASRYEVVDAIHISNTGGVYSAIDTKTNEKVVLKEARPFSDLYKNQDAISRLRKERDFMIANMNINEIPRYLDYFKEWEHEYIVMERLNGLPLNKFNNHNNPIFNNNSIYTKKDYSEILFCLWIKMTEILIKIHNNGYIHGDISYFNFIVYDDLNVKIIDFESSSEIRNFEDDRMATIGFMPYDKTRKLSPIEHDIYGLVSTFLATIYPINTIYSLLQKDSRRALRRYLLTISQLPIELENLFDDVLECNFERFNDKIQILEFLKKIKSNTTNKSSDVIMIKDEGIGKFKDKLLFSCIKRIDFWNRETIINADPHVFFTSNTAISYSASGVLHAFHQLDIADRSKLIGLILSKDLTKQPLGLYSGLAGIAWVLVENNINFGYNLYNYIASCWRDMENINLEYGLAGIGLSFLYAYSQSHNSFSLNEAKNIYLKISNSVYYDSEAIYAKKDNQRLLLGYYSGISGINYFYLELYAMTNDVNVFDTIMKDYSYYLYGINAIGRHFSVYASKECAADICTPYLDNGTSGVLRYLLRLYEKTESSEVLEMIDGLLTDLMMINITPFSGLDSGMAGIANTLLDAYLIFKNEEFLKKARAFINSIIMLSFDIDGDKYVSAKQLYKVSDDYRTGSLGVLCLLNRYLAIKNNGEKSIISIFA